MNEPPSWRKISAVTIRGENLKESKGDDGGLQIHSPAPDKNENARRFTPSDACVL
jgi:hypothetical protein